MKKGIFLIGFITLASILIAQEVKKDTPEIQKVHNTLEEIQECEGKLKLELIYEWSSEDEMDENKILYEPKDIAFNEEGEIFILTANWIKVFDKSRKYLRTIGGAGQGPGKLLNPYRFDIDRKNNAVVMDSDNRRIQILSSKGDYLESFLLEENIPGPIAITQNNEILILNRTQTTKPSSLWIFYNYNGQIIRERGERESNVSFAVNNRRYSFSFFLDKENNLYAAAEYRPYINKYSSEGDLQMELTYEVPKITAINYRGMDYADAERVNRGMDIDVGSKIFLLALTRLKEIEERKIGGTQVLMSRSTGKILKDEKIKFNVDPSETDLYQILVFDNSGKIVASKKLNIYVDNIRIFKDRLFLIDTHINMRILEYRFTVE